MAPNIKEEPAMETLEKAAEPEQDLHKSHFRENEPQPESKVEITTECKYQILLFDYWV